MSNPIESKFYVQYQELDAANNVIWLNASSIGYNDEQRALAIMEQFATDAPGLEFRVLEVTKRVVATMKKNVQEKQHE